MKIESLQNKKVKEWTSLKEKKERDKTNTFLIEGDHLLKEAMKHHLVIEVKVIAVTKKLEEKAINGPVLILDGIQDPGNLGTIIRSCVAFNMPNLLLSKECVDVYNPKVIRSTEGMIFHLNIVRKDLTEILPKLKETHQIIGTDVVNGISIKEIEKEKNIALIIGNEGNGLGISKKYCDKFVYIPMNKECESLNAGVSASILLYELGGLHE